MNKASFIDSINMAKAKRLMSAEIDSLLAQFKESPIPFDLELTSFSKTFGSQEDSFYDGGYSVICSVKNTNIEVQVLFGIASNGIIESLNKGDTLTEELKFVSYDSLYQRPIMGQVFSALSLNKKAAKKDQAINELTTSITSDLGANSEQSVSEDQLFRHRCQIICALRRRIEISDQETVSPTPESIGNPNAEQVEVGARRSDNSPKSTSPRTNDNSDLEDKSEITLNCTLWEGDPLSLVLVCAGGCFYGAYSIFYTYPYLSYFCIAFGIILGGLFSRIWFSKGAFLKLTPLGFELKTLIRNRPKKVAWSEIEKLQILTQSVKGVGITYTEASGRRKKNKQDVDQTLPISYPIEIKDLYLLVYAWKLGFNPTHLEILYNQEEEVRASILEYEKTL